MSLEPLSFLVGSWEGLETGRAGRGVGQRIYRMRFDVFLESHSRTEFTPDAGGAIQIHEEFSVFSADDTTVSLREFHAEGYVITYRLAESAGHRWEFASTSVEGVPPGYRARLVLERDGNDSFTEEFDLGLTDRDFEPFIRNRWTRID